MFVVGGVAVKFVGRGLQFSVWPDLDARENTWEKSYAVVLSRCVVLPRNIKRSRLTNIFLF